MPRSRGIATRAASALLFCAAALAALVFPEGAAGGRDVGFAPGQVPFDLLLIPGEDSPGVNPDDPRFDRGELCGELGGTLQDADQEEVCGGIDANDTFCIPGSAEAFPCRGLYKHVIVCNAGYNRPALNPFFCGAACRVGQQARGANCERVVTPAEAATFSPTLYVAESHSGAVAAVKAKAGVTLDFSPAADSSFILLPPPAEERDYAVLFPPPGFGAGLEVSLTARIVCAGCYPSRLTVIASLLPVRAPEQPRIAAVFGESFSAAPAAPGDYAGATLALAAAAAAGFSLESGTLTTSAGGGPDAGIYAVTVGATDSGFAGTLALVISAEISRRPLPEEAWGLRAGDERASATVAAGYPLPFHRAASRHTLAALVLPAPIAGLRTALTGTVAAFYADLSAGVLNTTAALTVRHRSDASSGKRNYADLAQTVAVWVSVVAAPAQGSFQATASAEIAGVSLAAPDFAAGEFLDLDPADEFNIGADGVVSGTPTQDALYELAAGWTTAGMLGTLTLAFQMIVGEGKIINPDDVVAVRTVERSAAAGFSGAGWTVTAAAGYTLDFRGEENNYDGHTVRALAGGEWALELTTALESEGRTVAARARALCGVCLAGQFVTVTAVFAAVLAPGQATLAGVYGEDGAAHELTPPANYATGGTFAVVGVSGPGGGFVVDGTGAGLARDSSDTPNAGVHVVSVAMTHPGFLGSLTLEVTASIARKIPSDVAGLSPQGRTTVTAAFGHTGEVFHLTLANGDYEFGRYDFSTINAGSVAALAKETDGIDDADRELTAAELLAGIKYLFGLTLAASADRLTLSAALTAALAEGEALPPADGTSFMLVYAQRRDGSRNFTDYGKFVFYRIETLDEPPVAGLRRTGPLAAGTALFDFSAGSYANGDYAGAVFSELGGAGGAAALDAAADGTAAVARELTAPGYYAITVLAASPEGADFVGTARLTLSLTLSRAIDLDAAVWPRVIVTAAARGFYGRGASFSVSAGYVVENPRYDFPSGQFSYDESSRTFVIPASSPLGVLAVTAAVTAEVGCARAEDLCDARAVTVTAIFNPVADPGQGTVTAIYGESFGRAARPPTGYETGGRFALLGVGGVDAAALSAISLRVDSSGGLTLDVAGGVGGALSAGTVTATIGMTHPDFLGTVALRTRLEILPADPGALYALSAAERNPGVVTVAAGWRGVAHRAELGAAAAGGGIVLPAESPRNVSLALSGDGRTVSFALSSSLDGGAEFAETIALTVTRNDLNYYDIGQTVELRVSALAVPAAVNRDGAGSPTNPFRSGNLHDFGQGVYAGAVFGKKSGADELRVSESGVVSVIPAGIGTSGSYVMVITATSGAFLGAAEFEFALDVGELGGLPGLYGVPPTARTARRKVAAGYTGSVAFFAASTVGVTLRTPDSSPAGFDFETEADFVSPGGFAVSLTLALSAGGAIGGAFEVAGQYAGYSDATIPLLVTIEALASPPLADTGGARTAPVSGDIFDFAGSDYADGDYQGASFRAAGGASSDLTVSARGQVSTARELGAGVYGVTVLAEGSSDYLGTATLGLSLTVRWVLEYGTDSGVGEVGAVDASGAVLTSGAQLSANARLTLRATPSDSHYVSGWTGACGGNVGGIGSADSPGIAQTCGLTAADNVRVRAVFSPAAVPAADGIAEGERVRRARTAAGYTGSVAFFAAAAEGATLRTPVLAPVGFGFSGSGLDFVSPAGFAVSLLGSPGAGKAATASFEAVASFRDYAETGITLRVEVSVLESPSPQSGRRAVGSGERLSAGGLHDFGVGDYAGAVFGKQSGAAALTVSEFGVVSAQDAAAGLYTIVMTATSAAFLGVAEFRYELDVAAPTAPLPAGDGVPPGARTVTVTVAAGHTGSVAFFAAAVSGAVLRTPDSSPAGFVFETGADFVSPGSFAISLSSALAAGETREGRFEVTASRAGNSATRIGLAVIVSALSSAPLAGVGLQVAPYSSDNIFDFADTVYADGVYGGAHFSEAGALSADLDVSAGGRVSASSLGGGVYGVTVAAGRSPYYLGTATLTLRLTVGWRVEYGGDPAADGEVTAADASGSALASGSVAAPGAAVTFRATPSSGHYVSGWTGACGGASRPGQIGSAARPGESQACGLTVSAHINVTANFAEGGSDLTIFNGAVVTATGQVVSVTLNNITVSSAANNLSVNMAYHGVLRNLHVMRLARWLIGASGITGGTGEFPGAHFRNVGIAAGVCGRDGWRVPTVGEIVGLSKSGAGPETVGRVAGPSSDYNVAPAGAAVGLSVSLPPAGGDDNADSLPDDRYELDSRDVGGAYAVVRYHSGFSDVRFPKTTADRKVICVKDAGNAADSPDLAAVRLESGGEIAGNPVASSTNPSPSFTVTATLSVSHSFGDGLFTGTVQAWKHKDAPVTLSGSRPLVTAASGLAAGYDIVITAAAGGSGTEVMVKVGSPPPLAIAGLTTLSLRAAAELGVTANIEVVVDVIGGQLFEAHYAAESVRGGVTIGGLSATLRGGGAVAPGGRANRGEDLHVTATPEADYYVVSWTGACAGTGAEVGDALSAGEAKTCVLADDVQTASVTFGAVFGRDECAASVSPCGENASCSVDPDHLAANSAVELECSCDSGFADDGSGFCAEIDVGDLIARGEREVLAYVSPTYTGSVAFFRAQDGATLRTPSSAPAGFAFATDTEFAAPAGVVVSMPSSLAEGGELTGVFTVTASAQGVAREIVLELTVRGLSRIFRSWRGLSSDSGELEVLTVSGFSGARFTVTASSSPAALSVSESGVISAPSGAGRGAVEHKLTVMGVAEHDDFLGRLPFVFAADVCTVVESPPVLSFDAGAQASLEIVTDSYARTGWAFLRFEACGLINRGADPHRALHRSARLAERGRALGLLLTLNADANMAVAGDDTGAGEYGTPLDVAVYNGVLENAQALRRGGGGCVFRGSAAECAAEHADYAGLAEVPADSIVAPASRSLTVTMGRLSPGKTAWGSFGVVARISTASPGPDPAQRVLLHPLPSDLARRFYHTDGETGEGIEFFSVYPGAGERARKRLTVQGVRNGMRPGKVTVAAVYEGLADISRSVDDTTPGANFYNLRTVSGLGGATFARHNTALSTPGFSVASDGMVSGPASFSVAATVFFLAKSDGFQGWAVGRLDVNPQTAPLDADSLIAERNPRITVLSGHAGDVYTLPTDALLARGYNLILGDSASVFAGGGLRREWNRIYIPGDRPMAAGETRTAALTVGVDCAACAAGSKLTLTATFVPLVLVAGAQPEITAQVNYDFDVSLNLPSGYGAEEGSSTRVPFSSAEGLYFSASRKNGRLSRRLSGRGGVEQLPPGTRVVAVLLTNPGFVGALTLQVTVHSTARPLGDLGVPASQLRTTVLVAPGFSGALPSPAAADARVRVRCERGDYPRGFAVSSDCDFTLASGAGERGVTVTAVETLSEFYETRTLTLAVLVKEIAAPRVEIYRKEPFLGVPATFSSNDYAGGIYRNAIFSATTSAHLISDEDGFVVTNGELFAGRYTLTVVADSSPDFLGAAALVVVVDVSPHENPGVSAARLDATVYAAAGYSGEIHRLVADDPRTELACAAATVDNIELTTDCVFLLVGGSGTRRGIFDFSQTVPGAAALSLRATVEARGLASPPEFVEDILTGSGAHLGEEDLLDLGGWAPAGLGGGTFAEAFADARYALIADDAGVVSLSVDGRARLAGAPGPGDYGATIHAYSESGGFAGTVVFSALIRARERRAVLAADSIPLSERFIAARVPRVFIGLTLWRAEPVNSDVVLTVVKQTLEFVVTEVTEGVMKQTLVFVATATTEFADSFQTERPVFNGCKAVKGEDKALLDQLALSGNSNRCLVYGIQENLVYKPADNAIVFTGAGEKSFAFKVRATREPAREWEADEFLVHIRLASHPKVPAVNVAVDRVSAVGRVLATLSVPGFPGALFSEATDSDNLFTVLPSGAVSLSGSTNPTVGASQLVVAATAAFSDGGYKRFYGRVLVTANIVFVSAGGVGFAGVTAAASGTVASVTLLDEYEREIVTVDAVYQGTRRGLHWIETAATLNRRDVFSSAYRGFAEQLCAAGGASGGKRWRVATIGEVAGILNSGTGPVTLAENNRFREIPGAANGLRIPLPTAERGGGKNLTDNTFVVSAHEVNGGRPLPVLYELDDGKTKLGGNNAAEDPGPRYACVLEAESFSPTPPLLGVRLEGDGRVLAGGAVSGVRGPAVPPVTRTELSGIFSESGQVVTITASAWRNVLTDSSFRRAAARDQPDALLTGAFSGSAGLTAEFSSSGGKTVAVVRLTITPTFAEEKRVFTLSFAPEFGATVSLAATVRSQAPAVSDKELAEALPPEFRGRVFRAAEGYSGALVTLSSSDSRFTLAPPTGDLDDGFGIERVGGNYVLTVSEIVDAADSRAVEIAATVSVVGRNSRRTATLSFSVEPLPSPLPEPIFLPVNRVGLFPFAQLKAGDFASAVFEKISGDARLQVDMQSGAVSVSVSAEARAWEKGRYHLVVGARDAGRFFGRALITVSLVVGMAKTILFQFNQRDVREPGDMVAVENLPGDARFLMTYRGVRRGLHWMESAAAGSSGDQRILCGRGGQGAWRVPTPSEVAGLLLSGETAEVGGVTLAPPEPTAPPAAENGAAVGARISLAAVSLAAEATVSLAGLSDGPFFADFLLGGRAAAAWAEDGKLHLSGTGAARYLCVLAEGEAYEIPERIAGIRAEVGGDAQSDGGVFSFRHGRIGAGEVYRVSVFAYNAPLSGLRDNDAASLRAEVLESGRYTARYEPDADAPGAGAVILESPGFLTEGESSATVRITPLAGAAVTLEITARAESIGERPVAAEASIPQADRLIIAEVPAYSTSLTVWRATPAHSSVMLTVVEREVEGEMTYFSQSFDLLSTVEGVDKEVLKYKAADNAVVWTGGTGDFAFKVRATRSPTLKWEPDEFLVHVRLIERTAVPAQSFVVERASAVGRVLATLSVPGFPGALFSEVADSDNLFTVLPSGAVSLSGSTNPTAGASQLVVAATAAFSDGGYKRFYGRVSVMANIVFVSAGGVGFAGVTVAAGDSADVVLKDEYEREIVTVAATYRGLRRGLHWIETSATVNRRDVFSSVYREFAEQLCAAGGASGGKRWRVATIGEVAGILNDGAGPAVLAENNRFREIPGAASGMRISLPTAARDGGKNLSGDAFVVSARDRRSSRVLPVIYEQAAGGGAKLGGNDVETVCPGDYSIVDSILPAGFMRTVCRQDKEVTEDEEEDTEVTEDEEDNCTQPCTPSGAGPRYVCVLETGSSSPLPPLLGARIEGNGRELAGGMVPRGERAPATPGLARAEAPPLTVQGATLTIRATGWNYGVGSQFRVVRVDHPQAVVSMTSSAAPDGFELVEAGALSQGEGRVIVRVNFEPDLYRAAMMTVSAWPQFGATVSAVVTLVTGKSAFVGGDALPEADLLAGLPLAARNIRVTVAVGGGFSGAAHRIAPASGSSLALDFAATENGGMSLAADGSVSPLTASLTALSAGEMLTAVFSITAGLAGYRSERVLVSVTAEAVVFQSSRGNFPESLTSGTLLNLREHSALLADATFARAGASSFLRVSRTGLVSSASSGGLMKRAAAYEMTVRARNPAAFLGDAYFRVVIEVNDPLFSADELEAVIPASARTVRRVALAGYTGEIRHTIVSGDSSAALDFPSAPVGFSLDSSGRISLAGAFSGAAIEGVFPVTVRKAGRQNAVIPVRAAVGPPQTETMFVAEFAPDTSGDLFDFGAGDLGGAVFTRDSSPDSELALSAAGVLSAPSGLAEGTYTLSGSASGGDILGSIPIGASVDVNPPTPPTFNGVTLTEKGESGTQVTVMETWCKGTGIGTSCRAALRGPATAEGYGRMTYHGLRRGLHWMLSRGGRTSSALHFFDAPVCEYGGTHDGRKWRLPTLGELAGGLAQDNAAGFVTLSALNIAYNTLVPGADVGLKIDYNAGFSSDDDSLPPLVADDGGGYLYASELIQLGTGQYGGSNSASTPVFSWPPEGGATLFAYAASFTEVRGRGMVVCVLEATDSYQRLPSLLGIRVKSNGAVLIGETKSANGNSPEREARVSAPAVSAAGAVYTLTATAWRHGRIFVPTVTNSAIKVRDEELPDAPLMMRLSGDSAGASFVLTSVAGEGVRVILEVDAAPTSERVLQLDIWPKFGLTVSIFVTLGVSTSGRAGSPDWEDDESRGGDVLADVLAFSAKAGVFPARPAAGGGVLAGGLAFAAAGDLERRELEHSGVFNSAATIRGEHSFNYLTSDGRQTRVVSPGSTARDFAHCLGAVSDLMIAHGIVRRRTGQPRMPPRERTARGG